MRHDGLPAAASLSGIGRAFGAGALPPVRYSMRVRPRGETSSEIEWAVLGLVLEEALHEPYRLELVTHVRGEEPELEELMRARVDVEIARGDDVRVLHGVVLRVELMGDLGDGVRIGLRLGPAVELSGLGRRSRIFQGRSVVEIAEAVLGPALADHGSELRVDRLVGSYPPRDYCVQYRESDLGFVRRILADEGIVMLFDHSSDTETVVLVDDNQALPAAGSEPLDEAEQLVPTLPYVPEREGELPVESIQKVTQGRRVNRGRWEASVWAWTERPPAACSTVLTDEEPRPSESWQEVDEGRPSEGLGGNEPVRDASPTRARHQRRRDETRELRLWGQTNATVLRAGSVFELAGSPHDELGTSWVVTRARHKGAVPDGSVYGSSTDATPDFRSEIECQPHGVPVAVERRPRPIVHGVHTAVVTGPEGESIHTDRYGRIRVRMLWDEHEHQGEETSCWLRVALPWAGDGFGAVFIPRVGTEVLVSFVDGDPDRPLCTGGIFNGGHLPPYPLPEHRTRTVLRTASTDAEGFNELSFEDAAGQEEVFLHAQRNLKETIKGNHTTSVGDCQRTWVGGARTVAVSKDDLLQVAGSQSRTVDGDLIDRVRGAVRLRVCEAPKEPTGTRGLGIAVEQGSVDIEAKDSIVLRCGASRLELHPDKVVVSSPQIVSQCPSQSARHSTSVVMTEGGIETAADELRVRTVDARLEADTRVVLGTGPGLSRAMVTLVDDDATIRAGKGVELRGETLTAAGTQKTQIKGSTCEVSGQTVAVGGGRIEIDADHQVQIATPGAVSIRGTEGIALN